MNSDCIFSILLFTNTKIIIHCLRMCQNTNSIDIPYFWKIQLIKSRYVCPTNDYKNNYKFNIIIHDVSRYLRTHNCISTSYTIKKNIFIIKTLLIYPIPVKIFQLTCLIDLIINNYSTNYIPTELGNLVNLKKLDINHNLIKILPPQLSLLTNLTYLNISRNPLIELPNLSPFNNLKSLCMECLNMQIIPIEIYKLNKLKIISFEDNHIQIIQTDIGLLTNLTTINFSENEIVNIPSEFYTLINLRIFNFSNNYFTNQYPKLSLLTNLTVSKFQYQKID